MSKDLLIVMVASVSEGQFRTSCWGGEETDFGVRQTSSNPGSAKFQTWFEKLMII